MRNLWLGVAMLAVVCGARVARAGDPLKPYVVLVLDTSGSMVCTSGGCGNPTGSGPPSCGGIDNKLNHAKCAINNIVNAYGDMVFALGRFRTTMGGTTTTNTFPAGCCEAGPAISGTNGCTAGPSCNSTSTGTGALLQLLTGLVDGGNQAAATFTNFSGNSCTTGGTDPEIWDAPGACPGGNGADGTCGGATPLEGVLNGTKRYWSGLQATDGTTLWPSTQAGFDPVRVDPLRASFLPPIGKLACDPNPNTCSTSASCTTNCCCVEQCRPYVVILLTDGAETCDGDPAAGAAALLQTDLALDGTTRRYRIETKPIGYGIAPGNTQIEAIAHAGGAADGPGFEGYYASDEASLQLAISSILDDAIRAEVCNEADDDCDGAIDEDFPNKGGTCTNGKLGVCRVDGTNECRLDGSSTQCDAGVDACTSLPPGATCSVQNSAGATVTGTCQAGACVPTPGTEVCNNLDDDCDGKIDENLSSCTCAPTGEQCDGIDNDCDGDIDENITKPCGSGVCNGTQVCNPLTGMFGPCLDGNGQPVPQPPFPDETCNGADDNCDGIVDGLSQACSTMDPLPPNNFPVDNPQNNPGHPANMPIPENICKPGLKTCPVGAGTFGACQGEIKPCNDPSNNTPDSCADICDGRDEDCDNLIDEDFTPADCSSNCGLGTTMCVNGQIVCNSVPVGDDDTCNNIDDDCDMMVDEGYTPPPGPCGAGVVCDGMFVCQNGVEVCVGDPIGQESCNCEDDNCNGEVDEGTLCGGGAQCKFCQCALPCAEDEFPCPMGKFCKVDQQPTCGGMGQPPCPGFCIVDPCFNVTCPDVNGEKYVCRPTANGNDYTCEAACTPSIAMCGANEVCIPATGECKPDNCHTFPEYCTADQLCIAGECKTDLCKNVECGSNQYCVAGECYGSCAGVTCPEGQRCRMGVCENDPCGHPCPFGHVCIESAGECRPDPCAQIPCPQGQYCNPQTVECEDDPCNGTSCPGVGQVCKGGTCFDEEDLLPDAAEEQRVTTGGGGGCSTGGGAGLLLALGLLTGVASRRRRPAGGRS